MTLRKRAAALLREPLVHFLLAGVLVFALLSGRPPDAGERRIVVDETVVARLVDRWTMTYRRPPTQGEIDGLIRDYVRDEVYYREALRLGLDKDDEVVRRRMRSKLAATSAAEAEAAVPGDADLQTLLDKDPARYAVDPLFDFEQVYFGSDMPAARQAAEAALGPLGMGSDVAGVPAPLPRNFSAASASDIAGSFGEEFAATLRGLVAGRWQGPIESGLGLHLVRVTKRTVPAPPRLADVRQRLENDWRAARIRTAEDEGLKRMLEGYDVVIQAP